MSTIVQIADFTGFYEIPQGDYSVNKLQLYIDKYEARYICELFGDGTAAFLADLDGNGIPSTEPYVSYYTPFCEIDTICCTGKTVISNGIKEMLIGFIFYHYTRQMSLKLTTAGIIQGSDENAKTFSPITQEAYSLERNNEAVRTFNEIYKKINNCCVKRMSITTIFV